MIEKFLIGFILGASGLVEKEADAWFPVEQPAEIPLNEEAVDPLIGVVFYKRFSDEKVFVRFPEAFLYEYLSDESMRVASSDGSLALEIQKKEADAFEKRLQAIASTPGVVLRSSDQKLGEIVYEYQGKSMKERIVFGEERVYRLSAAFDGSDDQKSSAFLNSFSLQNKF
ncbi:MAG: hypothetical protein A3E80_06685 [Chlamydiae bacterium RIFCSPHIGHO2_12_FULL_49_9]|nr:MAG: hypothetical protein A3E80_06685 [Chlamydiae bacterium RIFCSPHIGHO2_12_FULL_49_9]